MRLATEITVAAPLERAWPALLELGPVSLELGGRWEVSAMLDDTDEDGHAAGFHVVAHEHGGNGMAAATIRARASGGDHDGATRIAFETDLRMTGAAGRPDQAAAQAAADELLGRVAAHLERAASPAPQPIAEAAPVVEAAPEVGPPELPPEPTESEPPPLKGSDPLHLRKGSDPYPASDPLALTDPVIASGQVAERALLLTAGVALGLAVGRLVWRRR